MNTILSSILISVLVVGGIGLIIGIILSITSIIFSVPKNETVEQITEILPGANCGACGFSGCSGYAEALAKNKAKVGLCTVGGEEVAHKISEILGVKVESVDKKIALVHCMGNTDNTENKAEYIGERSCLSASTLASGLTSCEYGCIGFGDCVNACSFNAISICKGVAIVDKDKCKGCGTCVITCPRKLISLVSYKEQAIVKCSNKDKGAKTRKLCKTGCIGCQKCAKNCPSDAITITDFCAYVDTDKCTSCKTCVDNCPVGCITFFE